MSWNDAFDGLRGDAKHAEFEANNRTAYLTGVAASVWVTTLSTPHVTVLERHGHEGGYFGAGKPGGLTVARVVWDGTADVNPPNARLHLILIHLSFQHSHLKLSPESNSMIPRR